MEYVMIAVLVVLLGIGLNIQNRKGKQREEKQMRQYVSDELQKRGL